MLVNEAAFHGESLASWITRQASANGFESAHHYLMALARMEKIDGTVVPLIGRGKALHWAGRSWDEQPGKKMLESRFIQVQPRHFCPECLSEASYWRIAWEFTFVAFCPKHKVWLEDRCALCGSPQGFWSDTLNCQKCSSKLEFKQQRDLIADEKALTLAQILARSAESGGWTPDLVDLETPWVLPSPLSYEKLCRLTLLLGGYSRGRKGKPRKIPYKNDSATTRKVITNAAHALFPWPAAFHKFLDGVRDTGQPSISGEMSYFYKAIFSEFRRTEVGFIIDELEAYLRDNWNGVLSYRNRQLSPALIESQRLRPATAVARQRGISATVLRRAVEGGDVDGVVEYLPNGRKRISVRVDLLDDDVGELGFLSLKDATSILGLPDSRLRQLLEAGVLSGHPPVGGGAWSIPKQVVATLTDRLLRLSFQPKVGQTYPVDYLGRRFPSVAKQFQGFLLAIMDGDIPVNLNPSESLPLFKRIEVGIKDIRIWELNSYGYLSVPHAAELIGLKQEVAYHLVKKGLLSADIHPDAGAIISVQALKRFENNFVMATELAKKLNVASRSVVRMMEASGVRPVSGPGIDGGRQLVFERKHVHLLGR